MGNPLHRAIIDAILGVAVLILVVLAGVGVFGNLPRPVFVTAVGGLALAAVAGTVARMFTRQDHLKARQSHHLLEIADASLAHLRQGLDYASAEAVCRLALRESEAAAVAITDREVALGFAGTGGDHHAPGAPVPDGPTREAMDLGEHRILSSREEVGCPESSCPLRAAIVVPLEMRGRPCGTLTFFYTTPRLLNETQITMVEGLAQLLSTQLELSELDRQTEAAREAELKALQSQINPHFLFNTINTIAMLIRTDPARARVLLREFAQFYRRTLEEGEELVTLERELDYVHSYVTFERARFGERLQVEEDVDESVLGLEIPAFTLQPLVENAIKHGARPDGAIHVRIAADRAEDAVVIEVRDDGVGIAKKDLPRVLEPDFGSGLGIALRNVDERLKGHFGPESGLEIDSVTGEGTRVRVIVTGAANGSASEVGHAAEGTGM